MASPTSPRIDRIVVVAPSTSNNSIGRALVLVDVASALATTVEFIAHHDGPLWPGARAFHLLPTLIANQEELQRRLDDATDGSDGRVVVWVLKPWTESADWVAKWSTGRDGIWLWFDEDDFDEGVHDDWLRTLDPIRRTVFRVRHDRSPRRIRARIGYWGRRADLLTTSSSALGARLGWESQRTARVPHARNAVSWTPAAPSDALRFGFLGTPKAYKGAHVFEDLLSWCPKAELHVFAGTEDQFGLSPSHRERMFGHRGDVDNAVGSALSNVDVVVLPQSRSTPASEFQLPAKLIDALQHGRPVITTQTSTIAEFIQPGVFTVRDWADRDEVLAAVAALAAPATRNELGRAMCERFHDTLSVQATARELSAVWARASGLPDTA